MVKFTSFTVLALTAAGVSRVVALDILFRRFATVECDENSNIHHDTHLDDTHCKTFSDHEPAYNSFKIELEDDGEDLQLKRCEATVYSEQDCTGQSAPMGGK